MKSFARAPMLTVVLFALTSSPATVDHTQGLGGAVSGMLLRAPVAQAQQPLPLERVVVIGDSTGAASPGFSPLGGVSVSVERSEIVLVEVARGPIRVFDLAGRPVRSFGTRGTQPGEFTSPIDLRTTPGEIHVSDHATGHITSFTWEGELIGYRTARAPDPAEPFSLRTVRPARHGQLIATWSPVSGSGRNRPGAELQFRDLLLDESGEAVSELASYPLGQGHWVWSRGPDDLRLLPSTRTGHGGASTVVGDSVYVFVDSYTGAVSWRRVERGRTIEVRSRDLGWTPEPLRFDPDQARARLHEERGFPLAEIELVLPPFHGRVSSLLAAPNHDVWIGFRDEGGSGSEDEAEYLIVPYAEDEPTRHVTLPAGFALRGVTGGLIFGTRSEGGRATVEVYRIDG